MRTLTASVTSGDLISLLNLITNRGIEPKQIKRIDPITAHMQVNSREFKMICKIAERRGDACEIIQGIPGYVIYDAAIKRWSIMITGIVLFFLTMFLPAKVLFVRIDGNQRVTESQILLAAENCGIYFGADRRQLRSVVVKNKLLEMLPELGWACINTKGCVATIHVIEKVSSPGEISADNCSGNICAAKDGVVQKITVYSGFSEVQAGQAVKEGQILVRGSKKEGTLVRKVRPSADIYAITTNHLSACYMTEIDKKESFADPKAQYSLIVGKKLINLEKRSRICPHECDKIKTEYMLTLPGGFVLPLGMAVTTCMPYFSKATVSGEVDSTDMVKSYMKKHLLHNIVAGHLIREEQLPQENNINNRITARFHCYEMIGREYSEEIKSSYGEID